MIIKTLENRAPVFKGFDYIRICMGNAPAKKFPGGATIWGARACYRQKGGNSVDHSNRLEELVNKYENTLFRTALAILGDAQEAEDAVQDAYLRYLEKRPELRDGEHEKAWLLKVTANRCKSILRQRRRHPAVELLDVYPAPEGEGREVVEAVFSLPANQRAAVHLFYYEGYSSEEIAAILGQRPGTVRSHLSRARESLRNYLK